MEFPGEIRNQIYRLAFTSPEPVDGNCKAAAAALLRVSRTIHNEASSILYGKNTFTFGMDLNFRFRELGAVLTGYPLGMGIWPAATYHQWLQKLFVGVTFTCGNISEMQAPEHQVHDVKQMRKAFDSIWDRLDLTLDFQGDFHRMTFTLAWIQFRVFEPIANSKCTIRIPDSAPQVVQWNLRRILLGLDPKKDLPEEQLDALVEARSIAYDFYDHQRTGDYNTNTFGWRIVCGAPLISNTHLSIYDEQWLFRELPKKMDRQQARDMLLEDNELRMLALLDMPTETNLRIPSDVNLRYYWVLQEAAAKLVAMRRSVEEAEERAKKQKHIKTS